MTSRRSALLAGSFLLLLFASPWVITCLHDSRERQRQAAEDEATVAQLPSPTPEDVNVALTQIEKAMARNASDLSRCGRYFLPGAPAASYVDLLKLANKVR